MQAIGDTLREARMRQKIDIADVEAATKIRAKYLRALENEEFGLLPGPTFVRTFLRTYAEYLGLDAHLLVEAYRAQYEPREDADMQTFAPHTRPGGRMRPTRGGGRGPPPRGLLVGGAVALLLAFLLVLGLTGEEDGGGAGDQAGNTQTEAARPDRERERAREREPQARARRVTLRIAPAEATYVCIDNGNGKVLFEGIVSEPQTWRGRRLRLNMGKSTATVRVNGRRVPIEAGPNPVGFDFTPGKRTPLPLGQRPCA